MREKIGLQLPLKTGADVRVSGGKLFYSVATATILCSYQSFVFLSVVCVPISRWSYQRDDIMLKLTYIDSF